LGDSAGQALDLPPLLSVEQACELLGVSRSARYRAAATGDLPTLRWSHPRYVPTALRADRSAAGPARLPLERRDERRHPQAREHLHLLD
jgi:hypothetical protein